MLDKIDISIIIVNYNTSNLLKKCLTSIYIYTKDVSFEVIVVDNASSDQSLEMVQTYFPTVNLIESKQNLGFGKANNIGIKVSKGDYLFFLNSDTQLTMNSCKIFLDFVRHNQTMKIGCLGGLLLENSALIPPLHPFPSMSGRIKDVMRSYFSRFMKNKKINSSISPNDNEYYDVDYICGADMFVPRTVLDDVGSFDERFFMYYEEADLQKRMSKRGYRRIFVKKSVIIHESGASFGVKSRISNPRRLYDTESMFIYFFKHHSYPVCYFFQILYLCIISPCFFSYKYTKRENIDFFKILVKKYKK